MILTVLSAVFIQEKEMGGSRAKEGKGSTAVRVDLEDGQDGVTRGT